MQGNHPPAFMSLGLTLEKAVPLFMPREFMVPCSLRRLDFARPCRGFARRTATRARLLRQHAHNGAVEALPGVLVWYSGAD